jgi:coproporphyrinogen III oxidase-like Fe-S oxidoreductase
MTAKKSTAELLNQLFQIENNWENVLYVHTPFCVQKCYYCIYLSKKPESKEEMATFYNQVIPQQIQQYQSSLENVMFHQVYFGGGTPTIADPETLEGVYKKIPNFANIPLKATEASPYTIADEHIDLFHRWGFKYVSLGVQTLSEPILKAQNRLVPDKEKLNHICQRLEQSNIIYNIDLIFYLNTGELEDVSYSKEDLDYVMSTLRPVSLTIHYNYMSKKLFEKREAMINAINEVRTRYPEYQCVNSLLEPGDVAYDMKYHAEYRLMRTHKDFIFYMLPKIPESHTYGHNMLALGHYQKFKPRYNYFYIYDFLDKYAYMSMLNKLDSFILEFNRIRNILGLAPQHYVQKEDFFSDDEKKEKFKQILKKFGLPFHDFS